MRLQSAFVRFYKSFNYDHLRKIKARDIDPKPWEWIGDKFYPYIEISIDRHITAIVGANESGKSHLLTAIEKGLTGQSSYNRSEGNINRKDFCRYSPLYKSLKGEKQFPDFGFKWTDTDNCIDQIKNICKVDEERNFSHFFIFRTEREKITFYIPNDKSNSSEKFDSFTIAVPDLPEDLFPNVFRIDSDIALPDSVPIDHLIKGKYTGNSTENSTWESSGRERAFTAAKSLSSVNKFIGQILTTGKLPSNAGSGYLMPEKLRQEAESLSQELNASASSLKAEEIHRKGLEFNLAYDLIFKIAEINVKDIEILYEALRKGESGVHLSIVKNINNALKKKLNFPRIWAQDNNFDLRVQATEHDLSFIISDRTGREYSFDERSSGLRHFLSYYIQYLTHQPKGDSEILLMDEPDAFLSGEAQQDLLKVFHMFAIPEKGKGNDAVPVQVIYVTHSPFLIDKNHSERVRALEKAEGSKGTRVISGSAHNRYEPLRSAFGSFVGETTFISGCNLMVEGTADQILIAGAASYLRRLENIPESQLLDLNKITIVPASGAANIPYLAYLARGRDSEKPAVIILLDSDKAGNDAKKSLGKQGKHPGNSRVISENLVLQLGDITEADFKDILGTEKASILKIESVHSKFYELEDLIPKSLAVIATKKFITNIYSISEDDLSDLNEEKIDHEINNFLNTKDSSDKREGINVFEAINIILSKITPENNMHIDKVAFARTVIDMLPELSQKRVEDKKLGAITGLNEFEINLRVLLSHLRKMQKVAEKEVKDKKMRQIIQEKIEIFQNDHSNDIASRDEALDLLNDIESELEGDDKEINFVQKICSELRRDHSLNEDLFEPVRNFETFRDELEKLLNIRELSNDFIEYKVVSNRPDKNQQLVVKNNHAMAKKTIDGSSEVKEEESLPTPKSKKKKSTEPKA